MIRKILHPVHLVPETKKVGELLKELQKRRSHMAIVVDEHGSVSGLVTLEDLIEEIVGEIQDEYDWEERPVERMRDGSHGGGGDRLRGRAARDTTTSRCRSPPSSRRWPASCSSSSARCPRAARSSTTGEDWRFTVVDVERNRISKVKIEKLPAPVAKPEPVWPRGPHCGRRVSPGGLRRRLPDALARSARDAS